MFQFSSPGPPAQSSANTSPPSSGSGPSSSPPLARTPPSTPASVPPPSASPSMFALTAKKLERAFHAQLSPPSSSDREPRRSSSLRELVLLSNVWGQQQSLRHSQEELNEAARRQRAREEEERWLDGVLEEMLEEYDEADDDEGALEEGTAGRQEDFVSLMFRPEGEVQDSGFLDGDEDLDIPKLKHDVSPSETPLPPSPPSRSLTPPIPLPPAPNVSPSRRSPPPSPVGCNGDEDCCSPPLHPPALTPDSTPPSLSSLLLGTSADSDQSIESVESNLEDSYQWVAPSRSLVHSKTDSIQEVDEDEDVIALSLSRPASRATSPAPTSPHEPTSLALVLASHPLPRPPPPSMLTVPNAAAAGEAAAAKWTPQPPRSLSLPFAPPSPSTPARLSWKTSSGVGRGFYDCVDFGQPIPPARWPTEKDEEVPSSLTTATSQESSLALILARPVSLYRPRD